MARSARALVCIVGALALVCSLPAAANAAPGGVDPAFGRSGNGTVFADHGRHDFVVEVLRQPDGRIVTVANGSAANLDPIMVVSRYLPGGSLDPSFGGGGTFQAGLQGTGSVSGAVLQPDGKIVVVGWADPPADFFVTRLRANGTLDPSFAPAHPTTNFGGTSVDQAFAVALGPGGKIVVAGRSGQNIALARYTPTGALDPTFSGDGLATHDFGGQSEAEDVVVLPDSRIVVSGREDTGNGTPRVVLARFHTNGNIDASFGTGGRVDPASTPIRSTSALLLQGTKLVIAGSVDISTGGISRYAANGALDTTFGSAGTSVARVGKFFGIRDLVVDASGRLVAVGQAAYSDDFPDVATFVALLRFSSGGARDATFGCSGRVFTEVLGNGAGTTYDAAAATAAAAAGNDIVVGGFATHFDGTDFPPTDDLLARYDGDPPHSSGYALLRPDGGTSAFGGAPACGWIGGVTLNAPIVGVAFDPVAPGNWTVASDGGVFSFGAARFAGSMGGTRLAEPIVGMAAAPDGKGYWLVASDGGVFAFGSARFAGSMGGRRLVAPIVGMAAAKDGKGYWLVASDGGVFAFGSARFAGSMGGTRLVAPVVGIAADPDGTGYWLGARDGGVFSFAARFGGSNGATPFPAGSARATIGIAASP